MEIWLKIILALFAWWCICVGFVFRKGVFVERLRNEMPVLFMIPPWMSVTILIILMLIIAPYIMFIPFKETWRYIKLRRMAKRIRKMSAGRNPELENELKDIANKIDDIA